MNKNILLLSGVFFFIFFGFTSAQQFITSYFVDIGQESAGFNSLMGVYGGFLVGSLFLSGTIKNIGPKWSMVGAAFFYGLVVLSLTQENIFLIYLASFLNGLSGAFLWVSLPAYVIPALKGKDTGKALGIINSSVFLGGSIGSLVIGYLIPLLGYKMSFLIFSFAPIVALSIGLFLKPYSEESSTSKQGNIFGYFRNTDLLKLGFFYLATALVFGLFFSIVPIHIKDTLGISSVGVIAFLGYFLIMVLSPYLGKKIDTHDNKKIMLITSLLGVTAMGSLFFYTMNPIVIYVGVFLISLMFSIIPALIGSLTNKVSRKNNITQIASFFHVFGNIGIVLGIFLSLYNQSNSIYLIVSVLLIASIVSYLSLFKKSFEEIKERI